MNPQLIPSSGGLQWAREPYGIDSYWLADEAGKIVGSAGSMNLGGGAPYTGFAGKESLGSFITLTQAKDAVFKAVHGAA